MTNDEGRMTKEARMTNDEGRPNDGTAPGFFSTFVISHSFVIRYWSFVIASC